MKRNYTALEYRQKIRKLRAVRPGISISSDFIVGFPGETEKDFEATLKLIEDVGFDQGFSFVYSRRPGTPAANLADDTAEEIRKNVLLDCRHWSMLMPHKLHRRMIGSVESVLVEGISKKNPGELTGRTENMRYVNFAGNPRLMAASMSQLPKCVAIPCAEECGTSK